MPEKHPNELELLSFIEEELDDAARREVAEHLVACRACAGEIRRLETGKAALRAAPLLELPDSRREEILASLPERRDPWRLFRPVKRGLVVAAPVAGAAALVAVFVLAATQLDAGGDDDESAAVAEESERAAEDEATAEEGADTLMQTGVEQSTAPAEQDKAPGTLVRTARGPAAEIVRILENEGIPAEVDPDGHVVAEARAGEVEAALADRPPGNVRVYVR